MVSAVGRKVMIFSFIVLRFLYYIANVKLLCNTCGLCVGFCVVGCQWCGCVGGGLHLVGVG